MKNFNPKNFGFFIGLFFLFFTLLTSPPEGLSQSGWYVTGVVLLMASWWATEALPLPVTALIPLALFPLLGIYDLGDVSNPAKTETTPTKMNDNIFTLTTFMPINLALTGLSPTKNT